MKFFELREALYHAITETPPGRVIDESRAKKIRNAFYGRERQVGLSTFLKEDLGSYTLSALTRRLEA
jgi:hypothetical protein